MPIPLRLRRRPDGTLALTDHLSRVSGPDRVFPEEHFFLWQVMARESAIKMDGDKIRVELVNARALYEVVPDRADTMPEALAAQGVLARLVEAEFFDAPPIDRDRAKAIQEERFAKAQSAGDVAEAERATARLAEYQEA